MAYTTVNREENTKKLKKASSNKTVAANNPLTTQFHQPNIKKKSVQEGIKTGGLVRVTDYAPPTGVVNPQYSAETNSVSIGGVMVPVQGMENNRAYVERAALDQAYQQVMDRLGIRTGKQLADDWDEKYHVRLNESLAKLENRRPWSYQPERDPAYQAYKKMYEREGRLAYQDALASMSTRNGGNMTSAALTVANQQLGQYLGKLADRIPELQKNSYDRYLGDYNMNRQTYEQVAEHAARDWERMQAQNETAKADVQNWYQQERERTENRQADEQFSQEQRTAEQELLEGERAYQQAQIEKAWENAEKRGYFSWEEINLLHIAPNADGTYPTPQDIQIQQELRHFEQIEKQKLDYENWLAQILALAKIGAQAEETRKTKRLDHENQARARREQYGYNSKLKSQQHQHNKEMADYRYQLEFPGEE